MIRDHGNAPYLGSIRYDEATHVAVRSSGCGSPSPYKAGRTTVATGRFAGVTWTYRVYVPYSYSSAEPMPLIIQHPGWGMSAASEESGCGISSYADSLGFISVTAQAAIPDVPDVPARKSQPEPEPVP